MKRIISAIAAIFCCVAMSVAQTNFIATLQHDGNFRHFYGQDALTAAYAAAVDGDIITLSPGTFNWSGDFTKGITLRGNGVDAVEKTYISGGVTFYSKSSSLKTVVEGVVFINAVDVYNDASGDGQGHISFIKDTFKYGMYASSSSQFSKISGPKVRVYNCAVKVATRFRSNTYPDFVFLNCYIYSPDNSHYFSNLTTFVNCCIDYNDDSSTKSGADLANYLSFYNCIFRAHYRILPRSSVCYNCISVNGPDSFFSGVPGTNNKKAGGEEIFTNGFIHYELTEDAKSKYIGTDGTEIGIYGGMYPWNNTVQYPTVTTFQPEPKTSKEGILNIQVAVDEE